MERKEIIDSITEIVKELLHDIDDTVILPDDDLFITSSMSSIDYAKLLYLLEKKYKIEFDDNMLIYDEGITIAGIASKCKELIEESK